MQPSLVRYKYCVLLSCIVCLISSCQNNTKSFTLKERTLVKDNVQFLADSIAKNVSGEGPVAWLRYFENTPDFFMASDGQLVFPNFDTATNFINNTLVNSISKIELHWKNIRIDPLNSKLASIAAIFHEDITNPAGEKKSYEGYFTGITHQTSQGWKLRNAHWSIMK